MSEWRNTTHDWAGSVDLDHLARIRRNPGEFAPDGVPHLVLEVLAYAAEEAESTGGGHAVVTVHSDGSISEAQRLPDGHPRRGVPVTDLSPITDDGTTGTTVRFLPGEEIGPLRLPEIGDWPYLSVEVAR
ncbi:hypothetical protein ACIA2T_31650 [Amycolatopsis japonica]|uniref:hypothetical protein n=1 Tax=Amycolatopsis japonica TaxID=208439 RepID=UPI00379AE42B